MRTVLFEPGLSAQTLLISMWQLFRNYIWKNVVSQTRCNNRKSKCLGQICLNQIAVVRNPVVNSNGVYSWKDPLWPECPSTYWNSTENSAQRGTHGEALPSSVVFLLLKWILPSKWGRLFLFILYPVWCCASPSYHLLFSEFSSATILLICFCFEFSLGHYECFYPAAPLLSK